MKGQYLAVESVTTIGLGVLLAIGSITAFTSYRDQVMKSDEKKEANSVEAKISSAVYGLRYVESGSKSVNLPETIGSQDYTVALGNELRVATPGETYTTRIGLSQYSFSGTVSGGDAKVFKNGENFTLRAN